MAYQDYLDNEKLIITVATTGGVHGKETNPNLPETPEEIAEDVKRCEEFGASIVHLHGRKPSGERDGSQLQAIDDAIRERCDDIIIQNTTGGTGLSLDKRAAGIRTDPTPEMASLDMGPMNRYHHITSENTRYQYETLAREMQEKGIKPEMEVFNNGHLNEAIRLIKKGLVDEPYYINLIFGPGTLSIPSPNNLINMVQNLPEGAIFNTLGFGPHQLPLTTLSILMGGHARVGLEDNVYFSRGELAESNARLVERTAAIAEHLNRDIATPDEAREILNL
jgi:3-keto-5-aminohexanoate cleavage enzyme